MCRVDSSKSDEWCVYKQIEADGRISIERSIDLSQPQMMHDFAMTKNFVIFLDGAIVFDPKAMVRDGTMPFVTDTEKPCRIGIMRKSEPEDGIFQWFPVSTFVCFHTMNAWEEGDSKVCLCLCWCASPSSVANHCNCNECIVRHCIGLIETWQYNHLKAPWKCWACQV
jgi:carotenoid cleavage dioxygenase-like enzyme